MTTQNGPYTPTLYKLLAAFTFTLIYPIIRYNLAGNVALDQIPLYILNKSISFLMILILAMMYHYSGKKHLTDWSLLIKTLKSLTAIHVLISLSLLSPQYYPKIFADGKMIWSGNLFLLSGILGFVYGLYQSQKLDYLVFYILIGLHLIFLGFAGWMKPSEWTGYMPPITLICFAIILVLMVLSLIRRLKPDHKSLKTQESFQNPAL